MCNEARERVLISACLVGVNCRYDGGGTLLPELRALMECAQLIPICPEQLGGLPTPRIPAEKCAARVIARDGTDVTEQFERGAAAAKGIMELFGARYALLKERSPSCGAGEIYDGSFSHVRIPGDGVTAKLLKESGAEVFGESRARELIERLKEKQNDTIQQ